MSEVKVKIDKGVMTIELPMEEPTASNSGKSLTIASTHGIVRTDVKFENKFVNLGVNAYVKK